MRLFLTVFALLLALSGAADRRSPVHRAEPECGILYDSEAVVDEAEAELLAIAIYTEAGADTISDETRRMVGDVILNRVADPRYPDNIEAILTQRAQYARFYWTGVVWPSRAAHQSEKHAVDRARQIAREILGGEHSDIYGAGYIYQAEFRQGSSVIESDGIYFGR